MLVGSAASGNGRWSPSKARGVRASLGARMSVLVWAMIGIAVWHFAVLVPDRFAGGIIGALAAALGGALVSGYLLPLPGVPSDNPPGYMAAFWALPGALLAMAASYWAGSRRIQANA
jgi:uncharacterized membrane protein YeaQ/YmgE (transglycosylase-associated protein family)